MKKFFAIAVIAATLAACNNSGESKSAEDTATVKPDTTTMAPADTSSKMASDTSSKMSADTSKKADTTKKK